MWLGILLALAVTAIVLLLYAIYAHAGEATPISWEGLKALGPVILIALLGGVVAFLGKLRSGAARCFNFTEFIGDMVTAAVSGIFFYWLARGLEIDPWITAAIVGMAGHAGSRGLFMLEKWAEKKFDAVRTDKR